jgi:aryl-alcohol dehydrogenase-like predicted oxidoreductase
MKFILGCAQLGLKYGINNHNQFSYTESLKLLEEILSSKTISFIDTAREYGRSEEVIGKALGLSKRNLSNKIKVMTKISPLQESNNNQNSSLFLKVKKSINKSFKELGLTEVYSISFHRYEDWLIQDKKIINYLLELKKNGNVEKIGVSISRPDQLKALMDCSFIDSIQLPYNFLDSRWDKAISENQSKIKSKEIIARSIFLQGLIFSNDLNAWKKANVNSPTECLEKIRDIKKKFKIDSIAELAIRYAISCKWLNGIVIGVDSYNQFNLNMKSFNKNKFSKKELDYINENRPNLSYKTLNPENWQ